MNEGQASEHFYSWFDYNGLTIMAELEKNICIQTIHFCIAFYSKTVLKSRHWFVVVNIHVNKTLTQNIEHAHKYNM
jgi:hypothetical protein